jgi:hypothetical protein
MPLLVALAGCNEPTYLAERRPLETRPAAMGGGYAADDDLYVLPVRRPSSDERRAVTDEQHRRALALPVPWAGTRDFSIEIEWSVKNLDAQPVQAFFTINGGNEFGDYVPSLYIDPTAPAEDQVPPPPLLGGTPLDLAAHETRLGVFREDELDEAALDLEAITRYPDGDGAAAAPFKVLVRRSSADRTGLGGIPPSDVTPAVVRLALHLSAGGHVACDYSVRVRERGDKLADPTASNLYVSTKAMLAPPVAPPVMP